jgi:hypothetical protein
MKKGWDDTSAPVVEPVPVVAAATPTPYGTAQQPDVYTAPPPTNVLAIIALIAVFFFSIAGIVCGHIALSQIKHSGESGHGLALAAVILGYVFTALILLIVVAYVIFIFVILGFALNAANVSTFSQSG